MSSPLESPGSPALITTSTTSMPSLAKFQRPGADRGWYILVDPAGRYPAQARSERAFDFGPAIRSVIFLIRIVGCGVWAAHDKVSSPAIPLRAYRSRQLATVGRDTPTRSAISAFGSPSAASSTVRAPLRQPGLDRRGPQPTLQPLPIPVS